MFKTLGLGVLLILLVTYFIEGLALAAWLMNQPSDFSVVASVILTLFVFVTGAIGIYNVIFKLGNHLLGD